MPKKSRHWIRLVWKKCPVSNGPIAIVNGSSMAHPDAAIHYRTILRVKVKGKSLMLLVTVAA